MGTRRKRKIVGPRNLLTKEEIHDHKILIRSLTKQLSRAKNKGQRERATELFKQIRNLKAELWEHKQTRIKIHRPEPTYKGAEV